MYTINYYYTSNVGRCRSINQDNFYCNGKYMPYVNNGTEGVISDGFTTDKLTTIGIFDGMGGEEQGEMAAHLAAKELAGFSFGDDVAGSYSRYCKQANAVICKYTVENNLNCMGTTAALLTFKKDDMWLFNIGDSKIFEVNAGVLKQISVDHVSIAPVGRKAPLSQSLGIPEDELMLTPNIQKIPCKKGYRYLICSDGLTDMMTVAEIEAILRECTGKEAVEKLLAGALANGGKDNVTIVLAEVVKANGAGGIAKGLLIGGGALLLAAAVGVGAFMLLGKDGGDTVSGDDTTEDATAEDSSAEESTPAEDASKPDRPDSDKPTEDDAKNPSEDTETLKKIQEILDQAKEAENKEEDYATSLGIIEISLTFKYTGNEMLLEAKQKYLDLVKDNAIEKAIEAANAMAATDVNEAIALIEQTIKIYGGSDKLTQALADLTNEHKPSQNESNDGGSEDTSVDSSEESSENSVDDSSSQPEDGENDSSSQPAPEE